MIPAPPEPVQAADAPYAPADAVPDLYLDPALPLASSFDFDDELEQLVARLGLEAALLAPARRVELRSLSDFLA